MTDLHKNAPATPVTSGGTDHKERLQVIEPHDTDPIDRLQRQHGEAKHRADLLWNCVYRELARGGDNRVVLNELLCRATQATIGQNSYEVALGAALWDELLESEGL